MKKVWMILAGLVLLTGGMLAFPKLYYAREDKKSASVKKEAFYNYSNVSENDFATTVKILESEELFVTTRRISTDRERKAAKCYEMLDELERIMLSWGYGEDSIDEAWSMQIVHAEEEKLYLLEIIRLDFEWKYGYGTLLYDLKNEKIVMTDIMCFDPFAYETENPLIFSVEQQEAWENSLKEYYSDLPDWKFDENNFYTSKQIYFSALKKEFSVEAEMEIYNDIQQ